MSNQGTEDRDNHKERSAREESVVRRDTASDEIARKQPREQRVGCRDKETTESREQPTTTPMDFNIRNTSSR